MADRTDDDLMLLAVWMYYDENLTQQQIAQKLGLSQVKIARLLQRARREGIVEVQVRINRPLPRLYDLSRQLRDAFDVPEAILVHTYDSFEQTLTAAASAAAGHLMSVISRGCRVGVSGWSAPVARMADYLSPRSRNRPAVVNELLGSFLGPANQYNQSARIAQSLGAPVETLPAPAVVRSKAARDALLREPSVRGALEHARKSDIAVVGLGLVTPRWVVVESGQVSLQQVEMLRDMGVVGDIVLRFYDCNGQPVATDLDDRVMSVEWDDVRRIPHVITVACGPEKVDSILAALRGRLCHCLVTDTRTAEQVLLRGQ